MPDSRSMIHFVRTIALLCAFAPASRAATRYVAPSATGAADGSSWTDAHTSLQSALALAAPGDEILLAQGVYTPGPAGDRAATFLIPAGVHLRGGFAGPGAPDPSAFDPDAFATILSGDLQGDDQPGFVNTADNAYHVLTVPDGAGVVLRGLTVRAGNADGPTSNDQRGAGLFLERGDPSVEFCTFETNEAATAAGAHCVDASVRFTDCRFIANRALGSAAAIAWRIVDFFPEPRELHVERCTFAQNEAQGSVGAIIIYAVEGAVRLQASRFIGNSTPGPAACFFNVGGAVLTIDVVNCLFAANQAATGVCLWDEGSHGMTIVNCTFASNAATTPAGALVVSQPELVALLNSIAHTNAADLFDAPPALVAHSCIQGGAAGPGNIDADPLFVNPAAHDYRLRAASPCIDAASPDALPPGILTDLDALPRFVDDPAAPGPSTLDMGALERQPPFADLDADGAVAASDLAALLGSWGACPPPCAADLNGDGEVSSADLAALLGQWSN